MNAVKIFVAVSLFIGVGSLVLLTQVCRRDSSEETVIEATPIIIELPRPGSSAD